MIVGLVGTIGSGKNTVGDIFVNECGYVKESFAKTVKDAVSDIFDWPRDLLEGDTEESRIFRDTKDEFWSKRLGRDMTPRLALQLMGTEAGRNIFGESLWVSSLEKRITSRNHNIVITDVRFPNEIKMIRDLGGKILRIRRGGNPEWYNAALAYNRGVVRQKPDVHYSEWAWVGSPINFTINNDGTLEDLKRTIKHIHAMLTTEKI